MNLREKFLAKAKEKLKEEYAKEDLYLANVVRTVSSLEQAINLLGERLEEWYSLYFPELKVRGWENFARVVMAIEDKKNINEKTLAKIVGKKRAKKITEEGKKSKGAENFNLKEVKHLAQLILTLSSSKRHYEKVMEEEAKKLCPNASAIAPPKIVAMLIEHAGSLEKLSKLPSSTIQVLGAEKALFKYLRSGKGKPPKHGILFLHPWISKAPKRVRGKLARSIAAKLSIAFKVDYAKGEYIGDKLKAELEKRRREVMEND